MQSAYAELRGCSKSAVSKAVSKGRIQLYDGKVDVAEADRQWAKTTRARGDSRPAGTVEEVADDLQGNGYNSSRARRERYEADLAEMKVREAQGDLVRVAWVRQEMAKQIGQIRANLMQLPARLAPLVAAEGDVRKCRALLESSVRSLLSTLAEEETA